MGVMLFQLTVLTRCVTRQMQSVQTHQGVQLSVLVLFMKVLGELLGKEKGLVAQETLVHEFVSNPCSLNEVKATSG